MKHQLARRLVSTAALGLLLVTGCQPHTLSTSITPQGGGSISPASGTFQGNVTLVATPSQYYQFAGWAGAASGTSNPLTVSMDSDKQIVAQFTRIRYGLVVASDSADTGTVMPSSGPRDAGTQIEVTATPKTGYRFDRWSGSVSGSTNPIRVLMDADKNITANFIKQYTLSVKSNPNEGGSVKPGPGLYDAGKTLVLSAVPNFPYYPKSWIGTNTDSNPATVIIDSDKSITVNFEPTVKGGQKTGTGAVSNDALGRWGPIVSVPIQLNQFDWVQGEIVWQTPNTPNTPVASYIQDPSSSILKDFGSSRQANFNFMAQTDGRYTIVFKNNSIWYADYRLIYTIWTKP